jgi:hypothetical protein
VPDHDAIREIPGKTTKDVIVKQNLLHGFPWANKFVILYLVFIHVCLYNEGTVDSYLAVGDPYTITSGLIIPNIFILDEFCPQVASAARGLPGVYREKHEPGHQQ